MSPRADNPAREESAPHPGRVLFIGTSYYNNWYASRALRREGWVAETMACKGEGSADFLHGQDHFIDETQGLRDRWSRRLKDHVARTRTRFAQQLQEGRRGPDVYTGSVRWRTRLAMWLARVFPALLGNGVFREVLVYVLIEDLGEGRGPGTRELLRALMHAVRPERPDQLVYLMDILDRYDVVHFTGINGMRLLNFIDPYLFSVEPLGWDVEALRLSGLKVVYTNIGCLDGVSQSAFARWSDPPVCDICRWRDVPEVCSDQKNLTWGRLRNHVAHYQILLGGNRVDFNLDPRVHEDPEFYCLDPEVWCPELVVPDEYRLDHPVGTVRIYHAVGNYKERTHGENKNIKTTHIILPTIERLKRDGYPVAEVFVSGVPNRDVRFIQVQCDIFVDMLTYGFFGANIREAMMLGKVPVCWLRPAWLEQMRAEIPGYADELPVVSATPETVYDVLAGLIRDPERRAQIGRRARAFAVKWHSDAAAGRRLGAIYAALIRGEPRAPRPGDRR